MLMGHNSFNYIVVSNLEKDFYWAVYNFLGGHIAIENHTDHDTPSVGKISWWWSSTQGKKFIKLVQRINVF